MNTKPNTYTGYYYSKPTQKTFLPTLECFIDNKRF